MQMGDVFVVGLMIGAAFGSVITWYFTDLTRRKAADSVGRLRRDLETAEQLRRAQVPTRSPLSLPMPGQRRIPPAMLPPLTRSELDWYASQGLDPDTGESVRAAE